MKKLPPVEIMLKVIKIDNLIKAGLSCKKISKKLGYKNSQPSSVHGIYARNKHLIYYFKQRFLNVKLSK